MDFLKSIPFNAQLYIKSLVGTILAVAIVFTVGIQFFDYEVTTADPFGAPMASLILAYIVHLLIWSNQEHKARQ